MPDIVAFQELKMNVLTVNSLLLKLKGYKTFIDIIPGNAAKKLYAKGGIMLAFKKSTNFEILNHSSHEGWCILAKCRVNGKMFVFGNVYLPPENAKDYSEKLDRLDELLTCQKCDNVILCGDFNCTFSEADNSKHWLENHWTRGPLLSKFVEKWELQDSWRLHYPYDRWFTHRCHTYNSSRLDYAFTSLNTSAYIADCDIGMSYCSDHSPIHVDISFKTAKAKGQFIFPVDLCYSNEFRAKLEENWKRVLGDNSAAQPDTLLDLFKCTVNSSAISFKSFQKKIRKELVESFDSKIATATHLQDLEPSLLMKANYQEQIACLDKDLDYLFAERRKESHARNLARWYLQKGLTTSYFLNRFKKDKDKAIVLQLISGSGLITENRDILTEAHNYYSGLYKKDQCYPPFPETDEVPLCVILILLHWLHQLIWTSFILL